METNNFYDSVNDLYSTIKYESERKQAAKYGIVHPKEKMPIKILKGTISGISCAWGLALGCCTSYFGASILHSLVAWEKIESQAIRAVSKIGIISLSTLAGTGVSDMIFKTGEASNQIIDILSDQVFYNKLTEAMGKDPETKIRFKHNPSDISDDTNQES